MLVILIIFFFLFFPVQLLGLGSDDCKPTSCKKDGPRIQFPFRNKNLHPEYCGYPGFDAYCDENNQTVLVLPFSVSFIVKKINYVTQNVHLSDQENCLLKKLPYLNLSASPFYFPREALSNYNLFNCTASERRRDLYYLIPCLSDSNNEIYAIDSGGSMDYLPIISCTKIYEISSVPWDIVDRDNFHLNWAEPACGVCEAQGKRCSFFKNHTSGHQIQCIDIPNTKKQGTSKRLPITGATLGSFLVVITLAALVLYVRAYKHNSKKIEKFLENYRALKPTRFSYSDIRRITLQFREKLGEGGYGIVYKGKLSNEINIAVKVLTNSKGNGEEFVNEVCTIGRIHHVNVVRLLGFCAEGFRRALVYEFMPNDSLEKFIFQSDSKRRSLGWQKLRDIALGIAKGIEYLHQGCDQQILHFDIKPHNILLDHNFNPKICDFGLAKLCSKDQSAVTMTAARGTMGYIAPEVLSRAFGRVSHKSDIYSFGMLLLEMVGGRKNIDPNANTSQVYFPQWIYNHLDLDIGAQNEEGDDGNVKRRLTIVGLWCIQWCPNDRPSMSLAVEMLEGHEEKLEVPPNPFPATNAAISIAGVPEEHYQTATSFILE